MYNEVAPPAAGSTEAFLAQARQQVVQFYVAILNRTPEPGGLMYWLNQLQTANYGPLPPNQTREQVNAQARIRVASEILASDEAQTSYPASLSDAAFVRQWYQTALQRQPDSGELDTALAWLQSHSRGETIVHLIDGITAPADQAVFDPRVNAALPSTTTGQMRDTVVQNNVIEYDTLGRMTRVADGRFDVAFEYDRNDNRTRVVTRQAESVVDAHNTFDQKNRAVILHGDEVMINGEKRVVAGAQSHFIQYDLAGRRTRDSYTYRHAGVDTPTTEEFSYNAAGWLTLIRRGTVAIDQRLYDAAGRVVQSGQLVGDRAIEDNLKDFGIVAENRTYAYDLAGRMMRTKFRELNGSAKDDVYYTNGTSGLGYDAAGNLTHYSVVPSNSNAGRTQYTIEHVAFDSYKEKTVTGKVNDTSNTTKSSLSEYDVNGHLIKLTGAGDGTSMSLFANDVSGHILRKTYADQQGKAWSHDFNLIVNGEMLGSSNTRSNTLAGFANPYESAGASTHTSAPTIYHVQYVGETLQSVARAVWGDSQLWFLIADANGLNDSSTLAAGQILKIPTRSNTVHNDATTFKPYDPSASIGNTTPELPPAIPGEPCGGNGKILVAIVTVIVTVVVTWALGPKAGAETALAIKGTFATAEAAVLGAAAGNLAGQVVGNAIGVQQGFDFKSFTFSVLAAGASSGLPGPEKFGGNLTGIAYRAAVANALSQGIAITMDMQKGFDWRAMAASALGAAAGEYVGGKLGVNGAAPSSFDMADFGKRLLKSFAAGGTTAIAKGGKVSAVAVATDAFGNSLGESIAGHIEGQREDARQRAFYANAPDQSAAETQRWANLSQAATANENVSSVAFVDESGSSFMQDSQRRSIANNVTAYSRYLSASENAAYLANQAVNRESRTAQLGGNVGNLGGYIDADFVMHPYAASDVSYTDRTILTDFPVDFGITSAFGKVKAWFDGSQQGGLRIPNAAGYFDTTASPLGKSFTYGSLLAQTDDPEARFQLTSIGCANYGLNCREYAELGMIYDSGNPKYAEALFKYNSMNRFALGTATGVAAVFTGGLAASAVGSTAIGGTGLGTLASGVSAGAVGDITLQGLDNVAYMASGGQVGRLGFDINELFLSTAFGGLPGLPGTIRESATRFRQFGVPDWNLSIAMPKGTTLYSGPGAFVDALQVERIVIANAAEKQVFVNQLPAKLAEELALAKRLGVKPISPASPEFYNVIQQGPVKFAVTQQGELKVMQMYAADGREISHSVLTGGKPVISAGEADIAGDAVSGYFGLRLRPHSGHFLNGATAAQNAQVEAIAREAFMKYGINF